jgi:hypothetical protein
MKNLTQLPASYTLIGLLCTLLCSACQSKRSKPTDIVYDPDAQGTLEIPSYTRNALDGWPEGRSLEPTDASRVRHPEAIHAYHIGRLPSHDRRDMHEAHTVYRVEHSSRWDHRLPATPMASRGTVLGIREPSHNPVPADQIVTNERIKQIDLSQQLQTTLTTMTAKQAQLDAYLSSAPDKNKTIAELQQQRSKAEAELATLKAESAKMQAELKELKERQAMEDAIMKGSRPNATKAP